MRLCVLPNSRCARSAKIAQTWNGKRPWSGLQQGWVCQVCKNRADLERQEALERAPARMGVPGLQKSRRPGTAPCHRCGSRGCRCARSDKTTQTWNGKRPWSGLQQGWVCQVCKNRADLERQEALERAPARMGVPGLSKPRRPGTAPCHRCGSRGCRCARSDKTTQTWNGTMPWRRLYEGQVNFFLYIPVTVAQQIIFYLCRH